MRINKIHVITVMVMIVPFLLMFKYASIEDDKNVIEEFHVKKYKDTNLIRKKVEDELNNLTNLISTGNNKKIRSKLCNLLNEQYLIIYFYDEKQKSLTKSMRFTNYVPKGYFLDTSKWCEAIKSNKNILITKNKKYKVLNFGKHYIANNGNGYIVGIDVLIK